MAAVSLSAVSKKFGPNTVVDKVDLSIEAGEFVVILGPSGCGKSTLLRMIAGLEATSDGEIQIGDVVVNDLEPRARGCAMVFQNYALYPHMTVAENIGYALKVAGLPKADRIARIESVAQMLGLREFLDRKPMQLSGGQRQRVAMGRAMIREPKVFLYDEPLSNLDARLRVAMRAEIRRLHQRLGTTSLFVTHDQVEAMTLADRIVVMNQGRIEQIGTPDEIYRRPASAYVASFIGSPGLNLLRVNVSTNDGHIKFGDGQLLPYDRKIWKNLQDGPVTFGFRAEEARLASDGRGLSLRFAFSEELGSSRLIYGAVADEEAVLMIDHDEKFSADETAALSIPHSAMQFFSAETGRRIS